MRLAYQGAFGPSAALLADIKARGSVAWVAAQMDPALAQSKYSSGGTDAVHRPSGSINYCARSATGKLMTREYCAREYTTAEPLVRDFYANAVGRPDQLRQRVAFALGQILVVSGREISGTYGMREYHNRLMQAAFTTWREVLETAARSPVMGDYLDHVNNDPDAPNENFARELLQLFSIGPCELRPDGTPAPANGGCAATYDNTVVRHYAMALTGWTFPPGGTSEWSCRGNCRYYAGEMAAWPEQHNTDAHPLLSGVTVPKSSTPSQALERVLDSLMAHPNMAPFVARQMIQHLVTSNPSGTYVEAVGGAFRSGRYKQDGHEFGSGAAGDLAATVAAVLLHPEARSTNPGSNAGLLHQPALHIAALLRAFGGKTDGARVGKQWGADMMQPVFESPSVFNFYPPDHPVAGTALVGPAFAIHNPSTLFARLNYQRAMLDAGGIAYPEPGHKDPCRTKPTPVDCIQGGIGTTLDLLGQFGSVAHDAAALTDEVSLRVLGHALPEPQRRRVIDAVAWWTDRWGPEWRERRIATAGYLVLAAPDHQVLP